MTVTDSLSEDERYRTSTQYRLWSYTPQALFDLRSTTNQIAADRVREAVRRVREAQNTATKFGDAETGSADVTPVPEGEVECLTVDEELKLVAFYCRQTIQLGDHLGLPTDVKATAIQYMKRFYITNSLMTYHPADILKTALFFATKTENHYYRLTKFADAIGKTQPEDVLASEFLLTQALRFTFDVRHPYRALEGAIMDLLALSKNNPPLLPGGNLSTETPEKFESRIGAAYGTAKEYLKTSSLLTDVYFHFTPSQIMMAALLTADKELMTWYMQLKFPTSAMQEVQTKVLGTLHRCAEMLKTIDPRAEPSAAERKELQILAKKLKKCRNPEKLDLLSLHRAKREGEETGELEEQTLKKRKLESKKLAQEADDLFGPAVKKV
ncbi:hypothetical protein K3495_g900 [Podosphaera aphanis]|nr:hypothetical protein K3495_g900 [Podosphaera aphanis]